jgi:hypothetical protein
MGAQSALAKQRRGVVKKWERAALAVESVCVCSGETPSRGKEHCIPNQFTKS